MDTERLMAEAVRRSAGADALAAIAAYVRIETERLPCDAAVREALTAVVAELVGEDATGEVGPGAAPVIGLARTFLRQAAELVENPGRSGGWELVDPPLLQSIGRFSMAIVGAVAVAEQQLPGLADGLRGGRLLDLGTGVAWLAIALAHAHPGLTVVGIDIFEPALELARQNVADEGLGDRVELRHQDAAAVPAADTETYDAVWMPLPFLPRDVVPGVVRASVAALRPGGWLLPGAFTGSGDRLPQLLMDLRTVRSGGHPWADEELFKVLADHGLHHVQEVPRTWAAPIRLYAGQK